MDTPAQAAAYARADFAAPHQRVIDLFAEKFPRLPPRGYALELGCGPGDVVLRFARAHEGWQVHGVDGSPAMLEAASICHDRHPGLRDRVRLVQGFLPEPSLPRHRYDVVFSNSLLHHLDDPQVLWRSVRRWAENGAPVFIMDLRRPDSLADARDLTDRYAEGEPAVLRNDFFHSLLAALTPAEIRDQLRIAQLDHLKIETPSDRHVLIWGNR